MKQWIYRVQDESVYNEEYAEWVAGEEALARNMEDREYWRNELQGWVNPSVYDEECAEWVEEEEAFSNKLLSC